MKLNQKGLLIIISGPSGVGKSTVRKALFSLPNHHLVYSISMTTRPPRDNEVEGVDYYFVSHEEFLGRIKEDKFLEYANFVGNYYGTPKDMVDNNLEKGNEVILEIEVDGAQQVMQKKRDAVSIFLVPPSKKALIERLQTRKTDSKEVMEARLEKANREFSLAHKYDYIVVNDDVKNAADRIMAIIRAEHARTARSIYKYKKLLEDVI
ncbi:MAG: guanylate kinase [Acholeplasmatales bacterium]|nr:guanylate kinase [Acholeplasmatales bacterium]